MIAGCLADEVAEIVSLGNTLKLAHPDPRSPPDRRLERTHRGDEPAREEDQGLRSRLQFLIEAFSPATVVWRVSKSPPGGAPKPSRRRQRSIARTPDTGRKRITLGKFAAMREDG